VERASSQVGHVGQISSGIQTFIPGDGETAMGDKGSKDKGKKETQKKAQHTAKEKRKLKLEKKGKSA
jgi:hypothetical protein